ncbi:Card1-like endonuclease domain-containing protein [Nautilia sp.]
MTLVSVIGDFFSSVAPVFYDFFDDISTHIIISDDSKRDSRYARKFKEGVKNFCMEKNKNITQHFVRIDEDSGSAIDKACKYILENSKGDVYVNISDGLATLNTIMTQKLLNKGVTFISYDIFDNEYHIIGRNGIIKRKKAKPMSIREHFLLKNSEILSYETTDFAEKNEMLITELFEKYRYQFNVFKKKLTQNSVNIDDYPAIKQILMKLGFGLSKKELSLNKKTITGSLFEMYIYLIVKKLEFDDILMGAVIEDYEIKNEFDLLVIKNNHLSIIECKFKNFLKDAETLLFKYAFLRKVLDYDSKSLIISGSEVEKKYHRRAKLYDVEFVSIEERNFAKKIENFLKGEYD